MPTCPPSLRRYSTLLSMFVFFWFPASYLCAVMCAVCCSAPGSAMFIRSRDYRKVVQPMVMWILIFFSASHKVYVYVYYDERMHCLMVVVCIISGMYAGGEIPVPHLPTLLLVCCCHSTPDSSELSLPMAPHLPTHVQWECVFPHKFCDSSLGQQRTNRPML